MDVHNSCIIYTEPMKPVQLPPISPNVSASTGISSPMSENLTASDASETRVTERRHVGGNLADDYIRQNYDPHSHVVLDLPVALGPDLHQVSPTSVKDDAGLSRRRYWETVLLTPSAAAAEVKYTPPARQGGESETSVRKIIDKRRTTAVQGRIHVKRFPCRDCKERFSSRDDLLGHGQVCVEEKAVRPYVCSHCGASFRKNSNLAKHISLVELKLRPFACELCKATFGQKSNLTAHIRVKHKGERPFACSEEGCDKKFGQRSGLRAHIGTVHKGERKFSCECGSAFGHRGDLNRKHLHAYTFSYVS
jgi:hypothetical protein